MRRLLNHDAPPAGLVTLTGDYATAAAWESAFSAWGQARARWEADHPGVVLPQRVLADCPFEDGLPHGGAWSRPDHDEGTGVPRARSAAG